MLDFLLNHADEKIFLKINFKKLKFFILNLKKKYVQS